jgi:hypothetical protein
VLRLARLAEDLPEVAELDSTRCSGCLPAASSSMLRVRVLPVEQAPRAKTW